MNTPIYLDCDTGIDDALALAYLLSDPTSTVIGIGTVSGNTTSEQAAANTKALLHTVDADDIPVATGAHDHLSNAYAGGSPHVHGENGIGNVALAAGTQAITFETAADMLIRLAHEHAGNLRVVAIGPLTNIALALAAEPELPNLLSELVIMGGAVWEPGNITPLAEANIYHDPVAAEHVLRAAGSWKVVLVPLDVTRQHRFTDDDARTLADSGETMNIALATMLNYYIGFYASVDGIRAACLHDPLAAAIALHTIIPSEIRQTALTVGTRDDEQRGQTQPAGDGPVIHVVTALAENAAPEILRGVLAASTR